MGNRRRQEPSRLRNILLVTILLTVATVCFYVAFCLGQSAYEAANMGKLRAREGMVRELRLRGQDCATDLAKHKKGLLDSQALADSVSREIDSLTRSVANIKKAISERETATRQCQDDLRRMQLQQEGALVDVQEVKDLRVRDAKLSKQVESALALGSIPDMMRLIAQRKQLTQGITSAVAAGYGGTGSIHCPRDDYLYSVVFDIGSTGNRVNGFKFRLPVNAPREAYTHPQISQLDIGDSLYSINQVGLSTFASPDAAVASLDDLFARAEAYVPANHHRCTPVQFKATAGLRKTSKAFADAVLDGIRRRFAARQTLWLRGPTPARILEGGEEGPLAWLTVNYLVGNFKRQTSADAAATPKVRAATIDLGGGSAQIVFEPPAGTLAGRPASFVFNTSVDGQPVEAYQHSYEGLGLIAATEQLMESVLGRCGLEPPVETPWNPSSDLDSDDRQHQEEMHEYHRLHFPCFPVGYRENLTGVANIGKDTPTQTPGDSPGGEDKADDGGGRGAGGASFDGCAALFRTEVLREWVTCRESSCGVWGVYQPSLADFTGDVFAFSFVYDLMKPFFKENTDVGLFTVADVGLAGRQVCGALTMEKIEADSVESGGRPRALKPQRMCMYHAYVYAFLKYGLGVPDTVKMRVEKKIRDLELSWALGAALSEL